MLGTRYPIICSPMFQVSDLKLALAVHEAGCFPTFIHNDLESAYLFKKITGSNNFSIFLGLTDGSSVAQRQQIEGYLAWKWNAQVRQPSSHPYYYNQGIANLKLSAQIANSYAATNVFPIVPTNFGNLSLWFDAADPTTITTSGSNTIITWTTGSGTYTA